MFFCPAGHGIWWKVMEAWLCMWLCCGCAHGSFWNLLELSSVFWNFLEGSRSQWKVPEGHRNCQKVVEAWLCYGNCQNLVELWLCCGCAVEASTPFQMLPQRPKNLNFAASARAG